MPSTYDNRGRQRPLGITILCILGALGVLIGFFASIGLLGTGGAGSVIGMLMLVFTVGQAVVLGGLWTLQYWGYKWGLVFYGLSALLDLVTLSPVGLIVDAIIVVYLLSKEDHFR